ncbi:MAG: SCO family protein [Chitinophagales bacterium]|nr:SCO family protein [Chitinophagales bacterium]
MKASLNTMMKNKLTTIFFVMILVIPFLIFFTWNKVISGNQPLQILGPVVETDNGKEFHKIGDFEFIDQDSNRVSMVDAGSKILVANFFFTACPSICPEMTNQLSRVQNSLLDEDDVVIFSFTVDPERDTPEILASYADNYDIDPKIWHLLTGDKKSIYMVARNQFLLPVIEGDGGKEDFIHSELLVLVDQEKQIRGFYDGTDEKEVDRLMNDIYRLKKQKVK